MKKMTEDQPLPSCSNPVTKKILKVARERSRATVRSKDKDGGCLSNRARKKAQ